MACGRARASTLRARSWWFTRLPSDPAALSDNEIELDAESTDSLLWSGFYGSPTLAFGTQLEL